MGIWEIRSTGYSACTAACYPHWRLAPKGQKQLFPCANAEDLVEVVNEVSLLDRHMQLTYLLMIHCTLECHLTVSTHAGCAIARLEQHPTRVSVENEAAAKALIEGDSRFHLQ